MKLARNLRIRGDIDLRRRCAPIDDPGSKSRHPRRRLFFMPAWRFKELQLGTTVRDLAEVAPLPHRAGMARRPRSRHGHFDHPAPRPRRAADGQSVHRDRAARNFNFAARPALLRLENDDAHVRGARRVAVVHLHLRHARGQEPARGNNLDPAA